MFTTVRPYVHSSTTSARSGSANRPGIRVGRPAEGRIALQTAASGTAAKKSAPHSRRRVERRVANAPSTHRYGASRRAGNGGRECSRPVCLPAPARRSIPGRCGGSPRARPTDAAVALAAHAIPTAFSAERFVRVPDAMRFGVGRRARPLSRCGGWLRPPWCIKFAEVDSDFGRFASDSRSTRTGARDRRRPRKDAPSGWRRARGDSRGYSGPK